MSCSSEQNSFDKQPSEAKDYDVNWTNWLPSGDAISVVVPSADSGITLGSTILVGAIVKQFISGGVDGVNYKVTIQIRTVQGRIDEREFYIRVRER